MKHVVGLGNPGQKYKGTRHNVGFMVIDAMAGKKTAWRVSKSTGGLYFWTKIDQEEVEFFKPQGFMNKSGVAVKGILKKHPELTGENLYVVHDDLDIRLGEYKISFGKGPKDHNGLKNIYEQIGDKDFWHVRVGIDNGEARVSGEEYVLSRFKPEEKRLIEETIKKIIGELKDVLA